MLVAHPAENFHASKGAEIPDEASIVPDTPTSNTPAPPISDERKKELRALLRKKLLRIKKDAGRDRGMNNMSG